MSISTSSLIHPRFIPLAQDEPDGSWIPPQHTRASRLPPLRSTASFRGFVIDHARNTEVVYESLGERGFLTIASVNRRVAHYQEQPEKVAFVYPDGKPGEHTFDVLLTMDDGRRIAVDVKPKAKVASSNIMEIQRLIKEQVGRKFADVYLVRTEDHIHPDDVFDAQWILRARRLPCAASDEIVAKLVSTLHGWCRLADLVAAAGTEGDAFNAAVRLIGEGVLEVKDRSRISYDCFVRRASALSLAA